MAQTFLNMPAPNTVGDTFTTEGGREFIVVDRNGTLVWRERVLQIRTEQIDFATGAEVSPGRVVTIEEGGQFGTALQGEFSRAGVILSDPVDQILTPITNQQAGFQYFLYDVSALTGSPAGTTLVIRAVDSTNRLENFIMGTDASLAPYYTFRY